MSWCAWCGQLIYERRYFRRVAWLHGSDGEAYCLVEDEWRRATPRYVIEEQP